MTLTLSHRRLPCAIAALAAAAASLCAAADNAGAGASHWAFQPIAKPPPPAVKDEAWPRNAIDRFILARLEAEGLTPAADADPRTLHRRATYDLTGLPPAAEDADSFVDQPSLGALVDRLLESRAYGERYGRHWLDVVRYADTAGCSSDYPIHDAWRYRNYVIDSVAADKPFDQFIREQVAGDLLPAAGEEDRLENIVATGYLAIARRFGVSGKEEHLTIEDTIDNFGKAFLGLSVSCSRCHDHKYDPIPATDYYALYGFFQSTELPFPGAENSKLPTGMVPLCSEDEAAKLEAHEEKLEEMEGQRVALKREESKLRKGGAPSMGMTLDEVRKEMKSLESEVKKVAAKRPSVPVAYAVAEGKAGDARFQKRGEPGQKGDSVRRGFLTALGGETLPNEVKTSGRDQLADWVVAKDNPLTARVIANRAWQWHFGRGIVNTPNDFGTRGDAPSHPELLDYLASELIESGWSLKHLHRLIMASRTYALSAQAGAAALEKDASNSLFGRFARRRLESEEIVDSLLAASGELDRTPGEGHPFPERNKMGFTQHNPFVSTYDSMRRSVYWMQGRLRRHPVLATFDSADTNSTTGKRAHSTTPLQSLFMLNAPFVHDRAAALGKAIAGAHPGDAAAQTGALHRRVFARAATESERESGAAFLAHARQAHEKAGSKSAEADALASYARVLFSSNEFLHVE
ncbi:MAG: DUF1553 domain-containing protein [Verrucomicrobiales bacterium]